jgi:hypothetical protein
VESVAVATASAVGQPSRAGIRLRAAEAARVGSRASFYGLILTMPLRARVAIEDRSQGAIYGDYVDFLLFASDVFLLATLALWALGLTLDRRPLWLGPLLLRAGVIGLLAAAWLSTPLSVDVSLSAYNALRLTIVASLALYVANEVESVQRLLPALALMVLLQGAVAVVQVLDQGSIGIGVLGEHELDPNELGTSIVWTQDAPLLLRGYGLTDHPNILGGLLAAALIPLLTLRSRHGFWSLVSTAAVIVGLEALLLSFSRSGWLAFAVAAVLVAGLFAYRRLWDDLRGLGTVALLAGLVLLPLVVTYSDYLGTRTNPEVTEESTGRLQSPEARALSEREALAKNTNRLFVERPLQGVGIGALPVAMQREFPDFGFNFQPAHFALLTASAETGLLGGFCFGLLLVGPWALLWWRRDRLTPELITISGALLVVVVVGLFDYYTWSLAPGRLIFWTVLALWAVAYRRAGESRA